MIVDGQRVLYVNIAWMERYDGPEPGVAATHEDLNFASIDGKLRGGAPIQETGVDLTTLGAQPGWPHVRDVLVVWTAAEPKPAGRTQETRVVGWYRRATLLSSPKPYHVQDGTTKQMLDRAFIASCDTVDAFLLKPEDRAIVVPRAPRTLARDPVWHGDKDGSQVRRILQEMQEAERDWTGWFVRLAPSRFRRLLS